MLEYLLLRTTFGLVFAATLTLGLATNPDSILGTIEVVLAALSLGLVLRRDWDDVRLRPPSPK